MQPVSVHGQIVQTTSQGSIVTNQPLMQLAAEVHTNQIPEQQTNAAMQQQYLVSYVLLFYLIIECLHIQHLNKELSNLDTDFKTLNAFHIS